MMRIGLATPLFLVFLVLKLIGTIDWSWWLVTAPLWGPVVAAVTAFAVAGSLTLLGKALNNRAR